MTPNMNGRGIRCLSCTQRAAERIQGTSQDRHRDACRRMAGGTVDVGAVLLPGALAELPGFIGVGSPTTLLLGLCRACRVTSACGTASAELTGGGTTL